VAILELVFAERLHRHGDVLLLAFGIGEAKVHEAHFVFLDGLEDVGDCHCFSPVGWCFCEGNGGDDAGIAIGADRGSMKHATGRCTISI
jgi:hypothetical protein